MTLTKSVDDVTQSIVDLLASQTVVNFRAVYYGEEDRIPYIPSVSVSVSRSDETQGTSHRMVHTFDASVVIYHSRMTHSEGRKEANRQAEAIEKLLHGTTLDGIVVQSFVVGLQPGYSLRDEGVIIKSTAITWRGISRSIISNGQG